mgnify:CR=1 FL=1
MKFQSGTTYLEFEGHRVTASSLLNNVSVSISLDEQIQLHEYLGEQIALQINKEKTEMKEKLTVAKLLIALKNRDEGQMLRLNSSEQADLIPEVEKLLSELEKLQQENRNAKVDNQELYKEIEKLKSKIEELTGKYHYQLQVNDGLVNKNRSLEMSSDCWEKAKLIIKLIPNPESCSLLKLLESFVKNALAKERVSGWYVVLHKDWNKRKPLYYSKESNGWGDRYFTKEIEHQYDNSCFSYISPTPIDLGGQNEQ